MPRPRPRPGVAWPRLGLAMAWPDLCLGLGLGLAWPGLGLAWSRINLGFEKTWITALTTTGKRNLENICALPFYCAFLTWSKSATKADLS